MTEITISISDERLAELQELASASGLTAEDFLTRCIDQWLTRPEREFSQAAEHVLRKNAELYQRLA